VIIKVYSISTAADRHQEALLRFLDMAISTTATD